MEQTALSAILERAVHDGRLVGAVLAVSCDGNLVHHTAHGFADREQGTRTTLATRFRLASLSKAIVATTALCMIEDGKLALDDVVTAYLPRFRPALADGRRPEITIGQLLTHTAGLSYFADGTAPNGISDDGLDMATAMAQIAQQSLLHAPGERWQYSIAIDVLGAVIEQVSGLSLPAAIEQAVTKPLGMSDTSFFAARDDVAVAYADGAQGPTRIEGMIEIVTQSGDAFPAAPARAFYPPSYPSGGAGLIGSAADYLRFLEAVRTRHSILTGTTWQRAVANQIGDLPRSPAAPGNRFSFLGSVVEDPALAETVFSRGSIAWGGVYGNNWWVDFAAGLSVVLLTNTATEGLEGQTAVQIQREIYVLLRAGALNASPTT